MPGFFQSILNTPLLSRVRRNHGLEHATLHTLGRRFPRQPLAGYSDPGGFWLIGNIPTEAVQAAVEEALKRMQAGERNLAVHPNCGTNFAFSGLVAGIAAWLAMLGAGKSLRRRLDRLPLVTSLVTLVLILTYPLGAQIQERFTTDANLGDLRAVQIDRFERGGMPLQRVQTRDIAKTA